MRLPGDFDMNPIRAFKRYFCRRHTCKKFLLIVIGIYVVLLLGFIIILGGSSVRKDKDLKLDQDTNVRTGQDVQQGLVTKGMDIVVRDTNVSVDNNSLIIQATANLTKLKCYVCSGVTEGIVLGCTDDKVVKKSIKLRQSCDKNDDTVCIKLTEMRDDGDTNTTRLCGTRLPGEKDGCVEVLDEDNGRLLSERCVCNKNLCN